jgi:hypothetical protein
MRSVIDCGYCGAVRAKILLAQTMGGPFAISAVLGAP